MGFHGEVRAVVGEAGQPNRAVGQVVRDWGASGFVFGAEPLVPGSFGPVLADPLHHILDGIPAPQRLQNRAHRVLITIELGEQRQLIQGHLPSGRSHLRAGVR